MADKVAQAVAVTDNNVLNTMRGAVIKQDAQVLECLIQNFLPCCGSCCEFDNFYYVSALPDGKKALRGLSDDEGYRPDMDEINALPRTLVGKENSEGCVKCLLSACFCQAYRPFRMDFTDPGYAQSYFRLDRPCTFGGRFCCPHTISVEVGGQTVGRIKEDWECGNYICRCFEAAFCCRVPYNVQVNNGGVWEDKYRINTNFCACGPHCNYCGATPICNDMLWDVNRVVGGAVDESEPAGYIQKTYGGCCNIEAFARWCCCYADQFIVEWPENASAEDRALFMATAVLFEYVYYEKGALAQP